MNIIEEPGPVLGEIFRGAGEADVAAIITRDLPITCERLTLCDEQTHYFVRGLLGFNTPEARYVTPFASFNLAFLKDKDSEYYKSGIEDLTIDHHFQGCGLGGSLVERFFTLFKIHDHSKLQVLSEKMGTHFWQSLGFTATSDFVYLDHPEDDARDRVFISWNHQCRKVAEKLDYLRRRNLISSDLCEKAKNTLDPDDAKSIWDFLDLPDIITHPDDNKILARLSVVALERTDVSLEFDMANNAQMARFSAKQQNRPFSLDKFNQGKAAYIKWFKAECGPWAMDEEHPAPSPETFK